MEEIVKQIKATLPPQLSRAAFLTRIDPTDPIVESFSGQGMLHGTLDGKAGPHFLGSFTARDRYFDCPQIPASWHPESSTIELFDLGDTYQTGCVRMSNNQRCFLGSARRADGVLDDVLWFDREEPPTPLRKLL